MTRVVVAPDKFKGSLTAPEVAEALAAGLLRVAPDWDVQLLPVADGGEGTLDAAIAAGFRPVPAVVTGPVGDAVQAAIAVRAGTAVVELAAASGLARLPGGVLAPLRATSRGTGELIRLALDQGCDTVILGVGGSASTDGGAGMLRALGARLTDVSGAPIPDGGGPLQSLHSLDLGGLDRRLADCRFVLASDVDNPLLGPEGCVSVYAPQKGADAADQQLLTAGMANWARLVGGLWADVAGAGAAGGVGFAALAVLGAERRPGVDVVLELVGFRFALRGAALVVTGEGRLDQQSLHGKAPVGVVASAVAQGVPVVTVSGQCLLTPADLRGLGIERAYALADLEPDVDRSIRRAHELLVTVGAAIARDHITTEPPGARTAP